MTTKQMAEVAGVSPDTVKRKIREMFPDLMENGKKTSLKQQQAIAVMAELRKKNFVEPMQNAQEPTQDAQVGNDSINRAFQALAEGFRTLTAITNQHESRLQGLETTTKERAALLPAPQIKIKDRINMLVRDYAKAHKAEYAIVWSNLYKEFSYRTNTNPRACASTRSMSIIDYIETEGMLDTLEAVALDLLTLGGI